MNKFILFVTEDGSIRFLRNVDNIRLHGVTYEKTVIVMVVLCFPFCGLRYFSAEKCLEYFL
jgi:hypothetical protein